MDQESQQDRSMTSMHQSQPNQYMAHNRRKQVAQMQKTWHQLRFQNKDSEFQPTSNYTPIKVKKFANNKMYYSFTTKVLQHKPKPTYQPCESWRILIRKQQQWIQDLLQHVSFSRISDILTALEGTKHLIMVSDGSERDFPMVYGWILSSPGGQRLAHGAGNYKGRQSSLQAEAIGCSQQQSLWP